MKASKLLARVGLPFAMALCLIEALMVGGILADIAGFVIGLILGTALIVAFILSFAK